MPSALVRVIALVVPLVLGGCAVGMGTAATPTPSSIVAPGRFSPGVMLTADQLCTLLTPADWTAAGLSGARAPSIDTDGPGSAYCTYGSVSGATGGLELDVFVGATVDDAILTYATIDQSIPTPAVANLSGVDEALINTNIEPGFGAIVARVGRLVVTVTLPTSSNAATQLTSLTALVLSRALALE